MSFEEKSDAEISSLLTEYGIKHGPIVDSTRRLYEKKLEKAMEGAELNTSSDKTYYREEEEVTYITYSRSPVRHEVCGDTLRQRSNAEPAGDEEEEEEEASDEEEAQVESEPPIQVTSRSSVHQSALRSKEPVKRSAGCMWKMIRMLLLSAVLGAVLYYAYCHVVNNNEESPSKIE